MKEYLIDVRLETRVRVKAETLAAAKLLLGSKTKNHTVQFIPNSEDICPTEVAHVTRFELVAIDGDYL